MTPDTHRRRREGPARQEVHRQHPQSRDAGLEPVGARRRRQEHEAAHRWTAPTPSDDFTISNDSKWIGFRGLSPNRYKRGITPENIYADLYLLEAATGSIERLTNNAEIGESGAELLARQHADRLLGPGRPRELRHDATTASTSAPSRTRASRSASSATRSTATSPSASGRRTARRSTSTKASRRPTRSCRSTCATTRCGRSPRRRPASRSTRTTDTGVLLINYSDGTTPPTVFTVDTIANASTRTSWRQLTDPNPQVRGFALGAAGRDHVEVEGRHHGRRRAGEAGRLSRRPALPADRRDPRRAGRRPTSSGSTAATARRSTPAPATSCCARTIAARPTTAASTRPTSSATTSRPATTTS